MPVVVQELKAAVRRREGITQLLVVGSLFLDFRLHLRRLPEKALEVLSELVPRFDEIEDENEDVLTITAIMHPQTPEPEPDEQT